MGSLTIRNLDGLPSNRLKSERTRLILCPHRYCVRIGRPWGIADIERRS